MKKEVRGIIILVIIDAMVKVRKALEAQSIPVQVVSCGSTPACSLSDNWEGITEIHAGNYCCYDRLDICCCISSIEVK